MLPLPPPLPPLPTVKPRVMSAADFQKPGEPTLKQWNAAVEQLWHEGHTLAATLAVGEPAASYFTTVEDRARKIMAVKPLPLPPPPLPKPLPLPLPLPRK